MKKANMSCELMKVKSSDMLFSTAFPLRCESAGKRAALQLGRSFQRPLLSSVTPIDSPIKPVCQDVSPPHKTPSCHSWLQRTYLLCSTLNTALTRHYRGLWEYEFPVTWGEQRVTKVGTEQDSRRHKYWIWDWLGNHSNRRGRPRLLHTFSALLCRCSAARL